MPINIFSKQVKHDNIIRWLAFSVIALAVLIFYFPSLYYPPRADQVLYLAETSNIHHPWDLILGCYDHNRHRTFGAGDELLFRPLLYAILGSEQVLFGHQFWEWQLLGLLAHLTLIWVLLRLLWHLTNPWLAFVGTWMFALSVVNYEMVSWPHLSSYMFMMACMVGAVEQVIFCMEDNQLPWARMGQLLVYFFIACFIYETANIFVLLITGMLLISFPKMRWRVLLLITPVVSYVFFSYFNYAYIVHISPHIVGTAKGIDAGKYFFAVIHLSLWWLYEGLFNGVYHYLLVVRTVFLENEVMVFKPLVLNNPQVFLELIVLLAYSVLVWINRRQFFKKIKSLLILLGMLLFYVSVIVVGRYIELGNLITTVRVNSYFPYVFWVIVVIIAFILMSTKEVRTKLQQWLIIILVTASLLSGLWQGKRIYDMAAYYSNETRPNVVLVTTIDLLIQEKKLVSNFSFYVDPDYPGNYLYGMLRKNTDPPKEYSFIELLYPQYFRPKGVAKYKFLAIKAHIGVPNNSVSTK